MQFFEFHRGRAGRRLAFLVLFGTIVPFGVQASDGQSGTGKAPVAERGSDARKALRVEGIAIRAADESPRVLHILPWQPPTIRRNEREPLSPRAGNLLETVDPEAFRRHRSFRRTLDSGQLSK
ncbi:hypothetical protein C8D92_102322 [Tamilnaduibacter salinus]|uniref:Uncharacterized protein n=1 Tax=Tamilnaduibacter salinus TaxID=1484056 RepID=A0A2U1CZS4_9GAMM|nr:hypothetical protein [Tamilnaduibacter salinus]PVY78282.1 hypothetical protein C8D92_102322 [Tamilnaduibacter salinus]